MASQIVVAVKEELGVRHIVVPASIKQLNASPEREQWLAADRVALDALLAVPGNYLMTVAEAIAAGIPLFDTVTTRRVKVDQQTERLADKNGFKSASRSKRSAVHKGRSASASYCHPTAVCSAVRRAMHQALLRGRRWRRTESGPKRRDG